MDPMLLPRTGKVKEIICTLTMQKTVKTGNTARGSKASHSHSPLRLWHLPRVEDVGRKRGVRGGARKDEVGASRNKKKPNTRLHRIPSSLAGCRQNIRRCGGTKTTRVIGKWEGKEAATKGIKNKQPTQERPPNAEKTGEENKESNKRAREQTRARSGCLR